MPLADKIIELRKKQGWSQIDLADRLDVSRQSVSKWEMAQAVPELDKIIKMSDLFAVTTDYLLKDDIPAPEPASQPGPEPPAQESPAPEAPAQEPLAQEPPIQEPPAGPDRPEAPPPGRRPAPARKKGKPALLGFVALVLGVFIYLMWMNWHGGTHRGVPEPTSIPLPTPTPAPVLVQQAAADEAAPAETTPAPVPAPGDETVAEEPVLEQTAVSDPDAPEMGMTEYAYESAACIAGGVDAAELKAIAAEYEPFGIAYDAESGRWYFEGEPIRVFTDILTSNGESLTGGHFQGTIRNFAGEGTIDVRTVRDYEHCGGDGCGTLLYLETCDARGGSAQWVEHHPEDHHGEDRHE